MFHKVIRRIIIFLMVKTKDSAKYVNDVTVAARRAPQTAAEMDDAAPRLHLACTCTPSPPRPRAASLIIHLLISDKLCTCPDYNIHLFATSWNDAV